MADPGGAVPAAPEGAPALMWESAFLVALRGVFFLLCRHYVNRFLFSDLRSVIHEEAIASEADSPDIAAIALDDAENGVFLSSSSTGSNSSSSSSTATASSSTKGRVRGESSGGGPSGPSGSGMGAPLLSPRSQAAARRDSSINSLDTSKRVAAKKMNLLYPKLSTSLFCLSFSECSMLFTLVLFGEGFSPESRSLHWSISLLAVLWLIVFIIPLGLCFFLTHRTRATSATRTLILTLVPFGVYLVLFYRAGWYIASKADLEEGTHSLGLINSLLARVCVPGVMLIASLSGGGAVSTAWNAFEWRSISFAEPVSESQILSAERSLYRARMDIHQRTVALEDATASAEREAADSATQSYLSRWTSRTPARAQLANLRVELGALESMESQMVAEVALLRRRKQMRELGRSFSGRMWLAAGWALSVYCVWRVFISCVNLIFGYSQKHHHVAPPPAADPSLPPAEAPSGTDLITSLLGRLALVLDIDIDIAVWSRLIGLVLIGSIILANMRNVLHSVSRVFKATSTGISASFMLLFLAQLMSMYLLTSLISLPSSPSESSAILLDTLPDFNVFSRLFDSVFLVAAAVVFALRWIQSKLTVEV